MVTIHCDGCGSEIPRHSLRYTVQMDIRAAYDEVEVGLMDLVRDHREEILGLIAEMKGKPAEALEERQKDSTPVLHRSVEAAGARPDVARRWSVQSAFSREC